MSNMSYCRFQNTNKDLQDCFTNWEEISDSKSERKARKDIFETCVEIILMYSDDLNDAIKEFEEQEEWES